MKCSIQRGEAELNGTFHLSPNKKYLFHCTNEKTSIICFLYNLNKDSNSYTNLKEKA